MTHYSIQLRDLTFSKGYGLLPFVKDSRKENGKNSKDWSNKYSQKFLDHAKPFATDGKSTPKM